MGLLTPSTVPVKSLAAVPSRYCRTYRFFQFVFYFHVRRTNGSIVFLIIAMNHYIFKKNPNLRLMMSQDEPLWSALTMSSRNFTKISLALGRIGLIAPETTKRETVEIGKNEATIVLAMFLKNDSRSRHKHEPTRLPRGLTFIVLGAR